MERPNTIRRTTPDLISTLPNDVIHHIMGFLTAKEAIPTRFLSKRWEHLWPTLPFLTIDSRDITEGPNEKHDSERFVKFVYALLLRRKPSDISVFSLSLYSDPSYYRGHITNWVSHAVQLSPQVLSVGSFGGWLSHSMPQCIYTCSSLLELHFYGCGRIEVPRIVTLPKLRKLSIHNAVLINNQLNNILLGCPLLNDLWLDNCYLSDSVITHGRLQNMTMTSCKAFKARGIVESFLSYLPSITTVNMPSLTYARLGSGYLGGKDWETMVSFLCGLVNLEVFEVQFASKMLKERAVLPRLPIFQNLQDLSVGAFCRCYRFCSLAWILASSPNLKKLTILQDHNCNKCCGKKGARTSKYTDASLRVAISQCKRLELVEVKYWTYNQMVRQLVNALVDGTKELKDVKTLLSLQ